MRKRTHKLDKIAALPHPHEAGLGIVEIEKACKTEGLDFGRRALQRRLADLVKAQRVVKERERHAGRYLAAPISGDGRIATAPSLPA